MLRALPVATKALKNSGMKKMMKKASKPTLPKMLLATHSPVHVSLGRNDVLQHSRLLSVQKLQRQGRGQWQKSHHLIAQQKQTATRTVASLSFHNGPQAYRFLQRNGLTKLKNGTVTRLTVASKKQVTADRPSHHALSKMFASQKLGFGRTVLAKTSVPQRQLFAGRSRNASAVAVAVPQAMSFSQQTVLQRANVEMRKMSTSRGDVQASAVHTRHAPKFKQVAFATAPRGAQPTVWAGLRTPLMRASALTTAAALLLPMTASAMVGRPEISRASFCSEGPKLEGSQTHQNLCDAFAGESCANRRYLFFAQKADIEGHPEVASLFRATAEGETGHAHGHLYFLEEVGDPATSLPIGNSVSNLKSAVAGETHEYTDMYPAMAKTAREEGFDEIADWFETLAMAEKSHAGKFQRALEQLESEVQ